MGKADNKHIYQGVSDVFSFLKTNTDVKRELGGEAILAEVVRGRRLQRDDM